MNYTQIVAAIADLVHRTDLSTSIPTFILLAEAEMRRNLRVRQMEIDLSPTGIVDNRITLADNVLDVKHLWVPGYEHDPLDRQPLQTVISAGLSGTPTMFARTGPHDLFFNGGGTVQGVVYQLIPPLEANATNWLSEEAPDVYIYGALKQCSIYLKDESTTYDNQYQMAVSSLMGQDNRYSGPMRIRTR